MLHRTEGAQDSIEAEDMAESMLGTLQEDESAPGPVPHTREWEELEGRLVADLEEWGRDVNSHEARPSAPCVCVCSSARSDPPEFPAALSCQALGREVKRYERKVDEDEEILFPLMRTGVDSTPPRVHVPGLALDGISFDSPAKGKLLAAAKLKFDASPSLNFDLQLS